jgi:molybdopterin-guanine dinucleotide biosynthesis protein MobB
LDAPAVVSIVARSNTGKTTLIESLIPEIQSHGLSVGVLKHHERPTLFDLPRKDTSRVSLAGADVVVGVSPVQVATFRAAVEPDLDDILRSSFQDVDLVLTEGHRSGAYPKIEVHRAERSNELLCREDELLAAVTDVELPVHVPQFGLNDTRGIAAFLVRWLQTLDH